MNIAVYTGSFDPVHNGHIDVIERAANQFSKVVIGVLNNSAKTPLFSADERVNMMRQAIAHVPNAEVYAFNGLAVNFAVENNAKTIIRGLRATTDFEYELQMAQTNKVLMPSVDTLFLATALQYAYLSSTIVKEVASYRGDIGKFVPDFVEIKVRERILPNKK